MREREVWGGGKERDRQTDRQTETERDRERQRQRDRDRETETDTQRGHTTLLHKEIGFKHKSAFFFYKSVPDDKHSNTHYVKHEYK